MRVWPSQGIWPSNKGRWKPNNPRESRRFSRIKLSSPERGKSLSFNLLILYRNSWQQEMEHDLLYLSKENRINIDYTPYNPKTCPSFSYLYKILIHQNPLLTFAFFIYFDENPQTIIVPLFKLSRDFKQNLDPLDGFNAAIFPHRKRDYNCLWKHNLIVNSCKINIWL